MSSLNPCLRTSGASLKIVENREFQKNSVDHLLFPPRRCDAIDNISMRIQRPIRGVSCTRHSFPVSISFFEAGFPTNIPNARCTISPYLTLPVCQMVMRCDTLPLS